MVYKVLNDGDTFRRKNRFGVKLNAAHVVVAMSYSHYFAVGAKGRGLKAVRQTVAVNYPGMVTSYLKFAWKSGENVIVGHYTARCADPMVNFGEITKPGTEIFADCLMSEADAENGFY